MQQTLELARAVGVGSLGDDQIAVFLADIHGAVQARHLRPVIDLPRLGLAIDAYGIAQHLQVLRHGAAASAYDVDAEILDVTHHPLREIRRIHREEALPSIMMGKPALGSALISRGHSSLI